MSKARFKKAKHPEETLQEASDYLEYHINMYIHTFKLLVKQAVEQAPKGITTNSVLEAHMMHMRVIANFLSKEEGRHTDVLAVDFFHDMPGTYSPLKDEMVNEWAGRVGGWMVHITTKPMPILKSQQKWPYIELASKIIPALYCFIEVAPDSRFKEGHKEAILSHLSEVKIHLDPNDAENSVVEMPDIKI